MNGPRAEPFAIGSNLYCMVYGLEPYADGDDEGPVVVELLQDMKFPELRSGRLDSVIDRCWRGCYRQLKDLLEEAEALGGTTPWPEDAAILRGSFDSCRNECQALINDRLLESS